MKNDFASLTSLPKMGIPAAVVELAYPSEEWLVKQKKRNAIKVIFPQGAQMTYKAGADRLKRYNKQDKEVEVFEHASSLKSRPP